MPSQFQIPKGIDPATYLEGHTRQTELKLGTLGKFFGSEPASAVMSLLALTLMMAVVLVLFVIKPFTDALEAAKLLAPILTTIVGYLLGRRTSSE
jgi:hypothetical protein